LQLKPPADRRAAGAQRQQQAAEQREAEDHAGAVGEPVPTLVGAVQRGGEAQQLQGQDRKHAGHQVENDAAEKRQQQRLPPADRGLRFGRPRRGKRRADRVGAIGAAALHNQHAVDYRQRSRPAGRTRKDQFERVGPRLLSRFGSGIDEIRLDRVERGCRAFDAGQRRRRDRQAQFGRRNRGTRFERRLLR
jgi:hypothetical protein